MKTALYILLSLTLVLYSCDKKHPDCGMHTLGLDLQSDFHQDAVKIFVDGQEKFSDIVTTNQVIGLASSTHLNPAGCDHQIQVVVNTADTATEYIHQESDLFIGIGYNQGTHHISFTHSDQQFLYE